MCTYNTHPHVHAAVLTLDTRRRSSSRSSCYCLASPICPTASPVARSLFKSLDGVLPLISFVWLPLPLPRRTLRHRLCERTLSRSACTTLPSTGIYIHRTMQRRACIQMERLAFPRVHSRVQPVATRENERLSRGQKADGYLAEEWGYYCKAMTWRLSDKRGFYPSTCGSCLIARGIGRCPEITLVNKVSLQGILAPILVHFFFNQD